MKIKRTSTLTGVEHELEINVTQAQLDAYVHGLGLIQNIMPDLTSSEREFIMTGSTDEEWDEAFGDEL